MESFTKEIVANLLRNYFQPIHWAPLQTFYQRNWIWKANGRLQFRKYPTHLCTKMSRKENLCFLTRNFQSHQNSTIWNLVFILPVRILLKPWTLSFKKQHNHSQNCIRVILSRRTQTLWFTLQMEDLVLHSLVGIWDKFSEVILVMNLE